MVSVYTDADYLSAYKQKQRIFAGFLIMTGVYLALCISMLVFHISLPYASKLDIIPKILTYTGTVAYCVVMFPYMSIKYSRVRRYVKMLFYVSEGMKLEESNYFYTFRTKNLQKDHIDVGSCAFETWNKKRMEWDEREVYVDLEKPLPEIESGDYVRYISQSNFLIQYEILQKHAYEFSEYEEVDEDEEAIESEEENAENSAENNVEETQTESENV